MTNKEKLEFYKQQYEQEDGRRQEVNSALNIPIAFFSALVSALYFLTSHFNYQTEGFLKFTFLFFVSLSGLTLFIVLYFLVKANTDIFRGYIYSNIPSSEQLKKHNAELIEYYERYFQDPNRGEIEFENNLVQLFIDSADSNNYINEKRHSHIYASKQVLVIGVIFIILSLIPFGYNKLELTNQTVNNEVKKEEVDQIKQNIDSLLSCDKNVNQNVIIIQNENKSIRTIKKKEKLVLNINDDIIVKDTCIRILMKK